MKHLEEFNFQEGNKIYDKYEIVRLLGKGWEGEEYLVKEILTGIERTAKFFYPHRNKKGKTSKTYAKKLHKLKNCQMVIQYHSQELMYIEDQKVVFLISEFVEGNLLSEYIKKHKKLHPFMALHLIYALAKGMDQIHQAKEYHGDLHTDNIIVERSGLGFDLKILDFYHLGYANSEHIKDDVVDIIKIFYEILGGAKQYSKLPNEIKDICRGLKKSLILQKFKTAGQLAAYLENIDWE